jgi:hypothetical protein
MQLSKTYVWLLASQLLLALLMLCAAWQFFDKSARLYLIGVPVLYQLLMLLKGYNFWRKGQNTLAWGLTVVMPLAGLVTVYFVLQANR